LTKTPLLLMGAGGHATACIDVIEQDARWEVAGLVVSASEERQQLLGYPVLGADEDLAGLLGRFQHALVAVGHVRSAEPRLRLFELLQRLGYTLPAIVSARAYVSTHASLGSGTIVMHGAIVNAGARVGRNCIINSQALVEHDAVVADHCHVATAAVLNGGVRVGAGTFIGSGSRIREGVAIGERCLVGMGQLVLADCESGTQLPDKAGR